MWNENGEISLGLVFKIQCFIGIIASTIMDYDQVTIWVFEYTSFKLGCNTLYGKSCLHVFVLWGRYEWQSYF